MSAAKKVQKQAAAKKAAKKALKKTTAKESTAKKAAKKTTARQAAAPAVESESAPLRTDSEQAELRAALKERLDELVDEQQRFVESIATAQRDRLSDTAGDDQIDSGSKTVEHEHEVTVANAISERIRQVSHALDRLDDGDYGICEKCGKPIPAARLAAFPSATLCVSCKQLEERR
ncbi:TraR/DksA family transcriptional regulator [Glycomyces sp. L485]|uniref:TraR/DksA family transcriptional regulator n=1 Tax=Glycomyces sp. L485 TaxID=2909235 RepID=UPI001F4B080C|nr:TraR/DksA family transcriptional regulator [Glycomyces sp. L485]MCH7231899.1 TraR/DksA family transcriptional regulator [Glycomyces sp. L485]